MQGKDIEISDLKGQLQSSMLESFQQKDIVHAQKVYLSPIRESVDSLCRDDADMP